MQNELIQRIKRISDAYSSKLFQDFLDSISTTNEEKVCFIDMKSTFNPSSLSSMDFSSFLQNTDSAMLLESFFRPGAIGNIFINYHSALMNGWIHSHDFFEMIYVVRGYVIDWIDGVEITLRAGEICIHNPNALHKICKMKEGSDFVINILLPKDIFQRSFYSMLAANEELNQFFNNYMFSTNTNPNYMAFHNTSVRVDTIIELLLEEFLRAENSSRLVIESTLIVLFGEILRGYKSNPFMKKMISFISNNLEEISVEKAASYFGYHKNYFPHVVQKKTNYTFWQIVTDLRISKASTLLLTTTYSNEDISNIIGYKSTASFYAQFEARYHMTPAEFRKLNHGL